MLDKRRGVVMRKAIKEDVGPTMEIKTAVPLSRIMDLLCSALEGGANYWCSIDDCVEAPGAKPPMEKLGSFGLAQFRHIWLPFVEGCGVKCTEDAGDRGSKPKKHMLDRAAIERGLAVMATQHPLHFGDFMGKNNDATTGDVFLQCCLLGDIVYG